jgi:uncharacterized protein (DUF302 family)
MSDRIGSIKYSLREPFEQGVEAVCRSLLMRGLRLAGQMDISIGVRRSLGILLPPCRIVFVLPPPAILSAYSVDHQAAVYFPLHIVISDDNGHTGIQVQNRIRVDSQTDGPTVFDSVLETQAKMSEAIEAIAMRPGIAG